MANEFTVNFQENLKSQRRILTEKQRSKTQNPKVKNWLYPWAHERKYKSFLKREFVKPLKDFTINGLTNKITRWRNEVNDSVVFKEQFTYIRKDNFIDELNQFLNELKQEANGVLGDDEDIEKTILFVSLLGIAEEIFSFNNKQWGKQTEQVLGFAYETDDTFWEETRRQWANENYGHLQGYSEEYRRRIREVVNRGVRQNLTTKQIMEEIKGVNDWLDNKAELLARDQTGKLNGIITKRRMQEVGINAYIWITANDERVRPKHKAMNGKIMSWDDNNVYTTKEDIEYSKDGNIINMNWKPRTSEMEQGMIPGEAIQCRCSAIPFWEPVIQNADKEVA